MDSETCIDETRDMSGTDSHCCTQQASKNTMGVDLDSETLIPASEFKRDPDSDTASDTEEGEPNNMEAAHIKAKSPLVSVNAFKEELKIDTNENINEHCGKHATEATSGSCIDILYPRSSEKDYRAHDANTFLLAGLHNGCNNSATLTRNDIAAQETACLLMPNNLLKPVTCAEGITKEIIHETVGVSIIDLDNYKEAVKLVDLQEADSKTDFFSAQIHVISNDSQVDFLADRAPQVVMAPGTSQCSGNSYNVQKLHEKNNIVPNSQGMMYHEEKFSSQGERLQALANVDDDTFCNSAYENIGFSTIFSTLDDYQQPYDQSFHNSNDYPAQDYDNHESHFNFITDHAGQTYNESVSDIGMFGLSLTDSGYSGFFARADDLPRMDSDDALHNHFSHQPETLPEAAFVSSTTTAPSSYSEASALFHYMHHQPYHEGFQKFTTSGTPCTSDVVPARPSVFDVLHANPSAYESYFNDYYRHYQNYDNYCYHQQGAQGCSKTTYTTNWNLWAGVDPTYKKTASVMPPIQSPDTNLCGTAPSASIRDDVSTPEIVQFLQMEVNEEDEETDDADEFDDLPLTFYQGINDSSSDPVTPGSAASTSYHSDDGSITTTYSPAALTPPPSATSTPVPSSSQDNHMTEDIGFFSSWPSSHIEVPNKFIKSPKPFSSCKLSTEQLEASLLNYGLCQSTKRPFPSMADAMQGSHSKSGAMKKSDPQTDRFEPRRSGRPRKNQIQSDTISTSTTTVKNKKRKCFKSDEPVNSEPGNGQEDAQEQEAGSSNGAIRTARHNEPLNQHAVKIMTEWYEEHVHNPYPNKTDKEEMARKGGITENQVKSWFANKRNRTNNTKPKVHKRAMEEKLKELFRDLKRNHHNPQADNTHLIQQLSGIIEHCHSTKQE